MCGFIDVAKRSRTRHVCGGDIFDHGLLANGHYITPAIFSDCTDDMSFVTDEVFDPLMAILPFRTETEALRRANVTEFGWAGFVFTTDFARAHRVAHDIRAGTVWINDYNALPASIPFGGYKQSDIGWENGLAGIEKMVQF